MRPACAAIAVALALAGLAARAEEAGHARATLHVRSTSTRNVPGTAVLFDQGSLTFDVDRYLRPQGEERYGSTFASLSFDGALAGGDLRWFFTLDTGELRSRRFPRLALVCGSATGTGLDVPGSGNCSSLPFPLEETRLADPVLTSNGRPVGDEIEATLLVREAYFAWSFGRARFATVRAGRKRMAVADGFVYDDFATGVDVTLDLGAIGPRWELAASLFQPTRDFPGSVEGISPVFAVRADFLPSLFEHAGLFLALHRDRTGSIGEVVRGTVIEVETAALSRALGTLDDADDRLAAQGLAVALAAPLGSDASLAWLGTSGSLAPWRGQRIAWTLALLGGRLNRLYTPLLEGGAREHLDEPRPLRGRMLSVRYDTELADRVGAGAFFLYLSGGVPPERASDADYTAFLGIVPYVTATNLFFGGGLAETFAARQATAPGVNGRGVIAPGITLSFDPTETFGLAAKAAWLSAELTGPYGGKVYGTEADLNVSWAPKDWLVLGAELDVLWMGDFYTQRETVYKTVLAVDILTP